MLDENGNIKNHGGYDCTNGFNYYDTQFALDDSGVIWGGTVVVRIDKNNKAYFYDLNKIRVIGYHQDVNNINPVKIGSSDTLIEDSLSQESPTVNTNRQGDGSIVLALKGYKNITNTPKSRCFWVCL